MSDQNAYFEGEVYLIRSDSLADDSISEEEEEEDSISEEEEDSISEEEEDSISEEEEDSISEEEEDSISEEEEDSISEEEEDSISEEEEDSISEEEEDSISEEEEDSISEEEEDSISSTLHRSRSFQPFCSEFAEQINVGAAMGWARYLEEKDLSDEFSSVADDGWLKLFAKITLVSNETFTNALPPVFMRLPTHRFPNIDSGIAVRQQGTYRQIANNRNDLESPYGRGCWTDW